MKIMLIFLTLLFSFHSKICEAKKILENENVQHANNLTLTEKTRIEVPDTYKKIEHDQLNEKIGPVYPPFSKVTHEKWLKDHLVFRAKYSIGAFGIRTFPGKTGTRHLIIAGDSNVFGEGCNDNETLFTFLDQQLKDIHLYNFGHRGGGPHNTLSLIENFPVLSQVQESKGLFLYNFFAAHMIERVIGGKNYSGWDHGMSPWYSLSDRDELISNGSFKKRSMTAIYEWMSRSDFLNWLFPALPRISKDHLHLVAKIFEKIKMDYLQKFPEGKFVVILNQTSALKDLYTENLQLELKQLKIDSLILGTSDTDINKMIFPDGHFNPEGQRSQAGLLKQKLLEIFFLK